MADKLTWRQLKMIADKIPEELLDSQVIGWPEDDDTEGGIELTGFEVLDEDHLFDGDEGCCPASIAKESEDFDDSMNYLVHPKGTLILLYK